MERQLEIARGGKQRKIEEKSTASPFQHNQTKETSVLLREGCRSLCLPHLSIGVAPETGAELRHPRRVRDRPRGDSVHANAVGPPLQGQRPG